MRDNNLVQTSSAFLPSGEQMWFLEPTRTRIRPEDVKNNLGNLCRYNGGIKWSVLQHSILCLALAKAHDIPEELWPLIAAHDFAEAYIGDLPTGLKQVLPEWKALIEAPWEEHVNRSLGLPWPVSEKDHRQVKFIDHRALVIEMIIYGWPEAAETAEKYGGPPSNIERVAYQRVMQGNISWEDIRALLPGWE